MTIDVNVYLSRWPTRRLTYDETPKLAAKLEANDVRQAWVGSFDGLLHKDVAGVNTRLADECAQFGNGRLLPFGTVSPTLPDWREDVRRCHEEHRMPGLRLHPNYHGYKIDSPEFSELIAMADDRGMIIQLAVTMEDERTQHRLLRVDSVDLSPLLPIVRRHPNLRLVLLNALRGLRRDTMSELVAAGKVYFEIAMLEGLSGVGRLLNDLPVARLLFGSYAPFYYWESAWLKLREAGLPNFQFQAIANRNAEELLRRD